MILKSFFLGGLETGLNVLIRRDPALMAQCAVLQGQLLGFQVTPSIGLDCYIELLIDGVRLKMVPGRAADAMVVGTLLDFIRGKNLRIDGDATLAFDVQRLLKAIPLDWPEHLSGFTGDFVATKVERAVNASRDAFDNTQQTIKQNIQDYLTEEARYLPVKEAAEDFYRDVDELTQAVERSTLRVQRLERTHLESH